MGRVILHSATLFTANSLASVAIRRSLADDFGLYGQQVRTTGRWMATGKAWGLASSLWEALLAWVAGGGPVEATAPTASTATY